MKNTKETIALPNAPELERAVLTTLIQNPKLLTSVEEALSEDLFYQTNHKVIFSNLNEAQCQTGRSGFVALVQLLHAKGAGKEVLKLASELKNDFASELDFYGNIHVLSMMDVQRKLLTKALQVQQCIEKQDSMDSLTTYANEMADIVMGQNRQVKDFTFADSILGMEAMMNNKKTGGVSGVNTGIGVMNRFTDGWQSSDVIIIAGRVGMGKTIAGAHHAYHAALTGVPTAYVSLEVPQERLSARIVSSSTAIPFGRITKANLTPYERDLVMKKAREIEKLPLFYYDYKNSWDIQDISMTLRSWKRKYGIGLVIVDYIQLIRDRTVKDSSDSTKVVSQVSVKMKQLQSQLGCPVIELAQINRESEGRSNKRPGLENLKQSGQLEQDASTVIILYREDYYLDKEAQERGEEYLPNYNMEYIFAKHREGETGTLSLKCKPQFNLIYEDDLL